LVSYYLHFLHYKDTDLILTVQLFWYIFLPQNALLTFDNTLAEQASTIGILVLQSAIYTPARRHPIGTPAPGEKTALATLTGDQRCITNLNKT
jgi:hypothetical protein